MYRKKRAVGWVHLGIIVSLLAFGGALSFAAKQASVVAPSAEVKKLATGFRFVEGPVADATGNVYFSDIPNQRIHEWSLDGKVSVHRENSGGANGLFFDLRGNLIACEGGARQLTSDDMKGNITVLANSYDAKKLNSPNDLWIDPMGGIYFTDPRYGSMEGLEQDGMHVYYLPPDRKKLIRVCDDLKRPNGLIGTPDGKILYIADHGDGKTYLYNIQPNGTLAGKKLFVAERLDHIIVSTSFKPLEFLLQRVVGCQHHDGQMGKPRSVPQRAADLISIQTGHPDVQNDQIGLDIGCLLQCFCAVRDSKDLMPCLRQGNGHKFQDKVIIIYNENTRFHSLHSAS